VAAAENAFVSLAMSPEGATYLGRWHDLYPDELRAMFGLALAAIRQAEAGTAHSAKSAVSNLAAIASDAPELEDRLAAMTAALEQRDERIRELQRALKKSTQGN